MKIPQANNGSIVHGRKCTSVLGILIFLIIVLINKEVNGDLKYTDYCLSVNRELGKCVQLKSCPMFLDWVQQRPIVKTNLRLVVKFTCYFDLASPKVCCPVTEIDKITNQIADKFALDNEPSLSRSARTTSAPDFLFPSDNPQTNRRRIQKLKQFNKFQLLPELKDCSNSIRLDRLLETYGTHPWITLIGSKNKATGKFEHSCAGTIISKRYILTSAHCVYETTRTLTHIRVGDYNLDTEIDRGNIYLPQSTYKEYKVQKIIPHLGYHKTRRTDDIALIRVDKDINFSSTFVRPVCLPFAKQYGLSSFLKVDDLNDIIDKKALVTGWGKTTWNDATTGRVLMEAPVQFSPYDECENVYRDRLVIQPKQICVGGRRRQNSCVVDSGGPLLAPVKLNSTRVEGFMSPKMFQLGILSLGPSPQQCNETTLPSVYTKVSSYLDWILNSLEP